MLNGTWLAYLEEVDTSAKEMVDKLIKDMAVKQGINISILSTSFAEGSLIAPPSNQLYFNDC